MVEREAVDIQIRFDGPPGPVAGRFVEVETLDGKGIGIGRWERDARDPGCWLLKLTALRKGERDET